MDKLTAVLIIEGDDEVSKEQELEAWATLIASGDVWSLQGSYGRGAAALIRGGIIDHNGRILV